jgi:hypothetical protein
MISISYLYDIRTHMYDIRDDINYDIIHDGKVFIPTAENVLGRALSKLLSAGSSAGCSKSPSSSSFGACGRSS